MANELELELSRLSAVIDGGNATADDYLQRGKLYWKAGRRGEAMTDFNTAMALDSNSPAAMYLRMADDIMDFYNTDLYNP